MAESHKRRIARYYDQTQVLYSALWSRRHVHYGFWDARTLRRAEAMCNMSRVAARELNLPLGGRVLDAGCGVGGTSMLLAEEYGLEVVGLTLSESQLRRARRLAASCGASARPSFMLGDYMCTGFSDTSFDGIVAIESVCYAEPKEGFLAEAFRLLKPGGRLVVCDGFLARRVSVDQRRRYMRFLDGFALKELATIVHFKRGLRAAGFADLRCQDMTAAIMPSAVIIEALSLIGLVVCAVPCWVGLFPKAWLRHGLTGVVQRRLFQGGTFTYCVFTATKPAVPTGAEAFGSSVAALRAVKSIG